MPVLENKEEMACVAHGDSRNSAAIQWHKGEKFHSPLFCELQCSAVCEPTGTLGKLLKLGFLSCFVGKGIIVCERGGKMCLKGKQIKPGFPAASAPSPLGRVLHQSLETPCSYCRDI